MIVLIALICILMYPMATNGTIPVPENDPQMRALKNLFDATDGLNWDYERINTCLEDILAPQGGVPWNFSVSNGSYVHNPCSFMGVPCRHGVFTSLKSLYLPCGSLSGTIPHGLSNLNDLEDLVLLNNSLHGALPADLAQLRQLVLLDVSGNNFEGTIPPGYSNLTNLKILNVGQNRLTGTLPDGLWNLESMINLGLYTNYFSGTISSEVSRLRKLYSLLLHGNNLQGTIPEELELLTNLEKLSLDANQLTGSIPYFFRNMTELQLLSLSSNHLSGTLLPEFAKLGKLQYLGLTDNKFVGTIPPEYASLKEIHYLFLDINALTGTVPIVLFENLTKIETFGIGYNRLSGTLSPSLGKLKTLKTVYMDNNLFSGPIPIEFAELTNLRIFFLNNNEITGTIPEALTKMTNLDEIHLRGNRLSGTISESFGLKLNLSKLILADNMFTGTIPQSLGMLENLHHLMLSSNLLTGTIPHIFSNLGHLKMVTLFGNNLHGTLPEEIGQLTNLEQLVLYGNSLTGTIPELGDLRKLSILALGSNCMSGTIPTSWCKLKELSLLEFTSIGGGQNCRKSNFLGGSSFSGFTSKLLISGTLPTCLLNELPKLSKLYASGNHITGSIPKNIAHRVDVLDLSFNNLRGTLPASLINSAGRIVDLSHNLISGDLSNLNVPNATKLKGLNITVNNISGDIPKSLLSLENVEMLSGNVFTCSADRSKDLPAYDPMFSNYSCGSNLYMTSVIIFACVAVLSIAILLYCSNNPAYYGELQFWSDVADGKKWRNTKIDISINHIRKFTFHLFDISWTVLQMSPILLIVVIIYFAFSKERLLKYSYGWVSTAAYITGSYASITLMIVYTLIVAVLIFIMYRDEVGRIHQDVSKETASVSYDISNYLLFSARLFCLFVTIWGILVAGNLLYLKILQDSSLAVQDLFRLFFALFKWFWINIAAYFILDTEIFMFRMDKTKHEMLLEKLFGSKVRFMFFMDAICLFVIPIFTQTVTDPACFYNYFVAESTETLVSTKYCLNAFYGKTHNNCPSGQEVTSDLVITADIPFVYSYTCSAVILRTYVPLYATMYTFILLKCLLQYLFFYWDAMNEHQARSLQPRLSIKGKDVVLPPLNFFRWLLILTMPAHNLVWDNEERKVLYKNGYVFPSATKLWLWKFMPINLSTILILLTFGIESPSLGIMVMTSLLAENRLMHLIIGRFLVREMSAIAQSGKKFKTLQGTYDAITLQNDYRIREFAKDVEQRQ